MTVAPADVAGLLGPKEEPLLYIQQKVFHPSLDVESVLFTNERIIVRHRKDLGLKRDYNEYSYDDIKEITIETGILRSTIKCPLKSTDAPLILAELPTEDAENAYRIIRQNVTKHHTTAAADIQVSTDANPTPASRTISRDVGKIKCKYCGTLITESQDRCSYCLAKQ